MPYMPHMSSCIEHTGKLDICIYIGHLLSYSRNSEFAWQTTINKLFLSFTRIILRASSHMVENIHILYI